MDKQQASDNLERAINDWIRVSWPDETDLVTGWVLLTEVIPVEGERGTGGINVTTSDDLSLVRQLGILDWARTMGHQAVRAEPDD